MKSVSKAVIAIVLSGLLAAAFFAGSAAATGSAPVTATASAACTAATNIEAIVDDSGSMEITDPDKLRVQALNLLIQTLPKSTTLGAIEFGSGYEGFEGVGAVAAANTLFPPEPVGPNASAMSAALSTNINADNGATDYNAAFAKADADNPGSQARVFLTDGGHDVGPYTEAHLAHNVPTYVVGIGLVGGEEKARLKKIAADTGGQVYEIESAAEDQAAVNSIGAALTCQTPPRSFTDELSQGQSKTHTITVGPKTHSLQVTLTWPTPGDVFKLGGLRIKSHGKVIAVGRAKPTPKPKKLTLSTKAKSTTYTVFTVGHLRPGTLSFSVKAAKASGSVKVTTQVGGGSK
jgi:von Willebrand factor type A domain